jgi:putative glutamine amidotransferase
MPRLLVHLGILLAGGRGTQMTPASPKPAAPYHGVVISGGHDVDPVLYAQKSEVTPRYDPERDAFESEVIDDALKRNLPLLGICRGAQLLNVRLGGDLYQELRSRRLQTSNRWTIFPLKTLHVHDNTCLCDLLGSHSARINSLHNQGINRLGQGLQISGRDLDDIVQAVEDPARPFLVGVQWHPEFLLYMRRQRRLFKALVEAAKECRDRDC